MKMQYTPGPWVMDHRSLTTNPHNHAIHAECNRGIRKIAEVYKWEHDGEANARLIAAAPAMIEALRIIRMDLENNGEILGTDEKRIQVLTDAINEATR